MIQNIKSDNSFTNIFVKEGFMKSLVKKFFDIVSFYLFFNVIVSVFVFLSASLVYADEIHFHNGEIIKGVILNFTKESVEFSRDGDNGKVVKVIPRNEIYKILYDDGQFFILSGKHESVNLKDEKKKTRDPLSESGASEKNNGFIELESGWNGAVGSAGSRIDYLVTKLLSINGGAGIGWWGYKFTGGSRFYFNHPYGAALGISGVYNTGIKDYPRTTDTVDTSGNKKTEEVNYNLKPVTVINLSMLYSWKIPELGFKVYVETGWAQALNKNPYSYFTASGNAISAKEKYYMFWRKPGGFIASAGVGFGF